MLGLGLVLSLFLPSLHPDAFPSIANRHVASLAESAAGAATGALLLLAVRTLGSVLFKKEAMGLGDVKLLAMIGAYTSPVGVVYVLLLASLVGAVLGSFFHFSRKRSLAPVQGTLAKGRLAFTRARIAEDRVDALVSGDAPAVGEKVDVSLVIEKDDNWFESDVHVAAEGTVESVTSHEGGRLVRVALEKTKESDADALSTFAHARVAVPFGPFLALGGFAVVLWLPEIAHFVTDTWPRFVRG
jgi:prepilin signal peptidase PulO-like enzyme (type II secretory pathway)